MYLEYGLSFHLSHQISLPLRLGWSYTKRELDVLSIQIREHTHQKRTRNWRHEVRCLRWTVFLYAAPSLRQKRRLDQHTKDVLQYTWRHDESFNSSFAFKKVTIQLIWNEKLLFNALKTHSTFAVSNTTSTTHYY